MSSEERDLPASRQKLRKARQKGQVAQSRDFNTAMSLIAVIAYLTASLGDLVLGYQALWKIPLDFHDGDRIRTLNAVASHLGAMFVSFVGPLLGISVAASVLSDLAMKGGFVLSFDPISPKFDRLNPIAGLGNLFSLRKLIDLMKALAKISILGAAEVVILSGVVNTLIWMPRGGTDVMPAVWAGLMKSLSGVAIAVFAVNGVIDMRLQSWLFMREQRMSKTEKKTEAKDQAQNPEIMREVRRQSRGAANDPRTALRKATIVIGDDDGIIALHFVKGESTAPICVVKERGKTASRLLRDAERLGIAVEYDIAFVDAFFDTTPKNGFPAVESYGRLATIMKRHALL